ncbi:arylsulfatase [Longispora fulva]|uniref:Arylsulfatase A-like enzyme n=1 Tax=Longispora fulva TaxID=619741 RepID=A0A8J7GGQ1_9ACTN|nr:arylsulfatase [Longispora fulva]MBG6135818.1 arylsulfatase A-like enzyme [Longispora fulva]GIG55938.1 arylsulfatase [Longispora fulva]
MPVNILLLFADQWRGDCLSAAGHPVVETPYLDRLASSGTRFTRAYSSTPSCVPARAALMTGLSAASHGRVGYRDGVPWDYETTLAGEFTRHGYRTHAVGKMHVYPERNLLGFETVELHDGYLHFARRNADDLAEIDDYVTWLRTASGRPDADYAENGLDCNSVVARPWDKPEWQHPTNWTAARTVEFLRTRDRDRPFFLFSSFHRPHPPYDPPAWAFEQYLTRPMPAPPVGDWAATMWQATGDPLNPTSPYLELPEHRLRRARAGYYGNISHIDQQVNRILDALNEHGAEDTIVLFSSDHGEMMGDHHLYRKAVPYEGSARVPFLLAGPGIARGVVRDDLAELRDVMPTLLAAAGLPIPGSVEGEALVDVERAPRAHLHGEHTDHYCGQHGSIQWITDERHKYVWRSSDGLEQLFDLTADPGEVHDLAGTEPRTVEKLRAILVEELKNRPQGLVRDGQLVTGVQVSPVLPHDATAQGS